MKKTFELTPVEKSLQAQFNPDANALKELIANFYQQAAKAQATSLHNAIMFGLAALSIKPIIGHGKFGKWLEDTLGGKTAKSSAYTWIECANLFVSKIDNCTGGDLVSDRIREAADVLGFTDGDKLSTALSNSKDCNALISYISGTFTIAEYLNIMRNARTCALDVEEQERKALEQARTPDLRGLKKASGNPQQTDFFDIMYEEARATVEVMREDPRFMEMPKDKMLKYGNYLMTQANTIISIANAKMD